MEQSTSLLLLVFNEIYLNPLLPQNHCLYLINKRRDILVHAAADAISADNWRVINGNEFAYIAAKLSVIVFERTIELLKQTGVFDDALVAQSPTPVQHKIIAIANCKDKLTQEDILTALLHGREIVAETIKAANCPLTIGQLS